MKMLAAVASPSAGTVSEICVKISESVGSKDLLVRLEKEPRIDQENREAFSILSQTEAILDLSLEPNQWPHSPAKPPNSSRSL